MIIYLLFYDRDCGNREDWNTFYTPVEAFTTSDLRQARIDHLKSLDDTLDFETKDVEINPATDAPHD